MTKFDYCSDLHLEFCEHYYTGYTPKIDEILVNQQSDNLIVAGDLCAINTKGSNPEKYLEIINNFYEFATNHWKNVIFVLGNHDYWFNSFENAPVRYQSLMPEVHVCSIKTNPVVDFEDFVVIGDTLWSDLTNHPMIQYDMNDYRFIQSDNNKPFHINTDDTTNHFKQARDKIFQLVDHYKEKPVIVVTHHCPSFKSADSKQHYLAPAYATNLEQQIIDHPNIKYWVHGHVHQPQDYIIGSTHIVCNPRGYYGYDYEHDNLSCHLKQFEV